MGYKNNQSFVVGMNFCHHSKIQVEEHLDVLQTVKASNEQS